MIISTRGRYALRFMLDLAEHCSDGYVPMKAVAERQRISLKYLEQIIPVLSKAKLVDVSYGKGGGYRLSKAPEEYSVREILQHTDGNFAPVACLECDADVCEHAESCKTLPMWQKLSSMISNFFEVITLKDLIDGNIDNL